jgi:hypothetical protein
MQRQPRRVHRAGRMVEAEHKFDRVLLQQESDLPAPHFTIQTRVGSTGSQEFSGAD